MTPDKNDTLMIFNWDKLRRLQSDLQSCVDLIIMGIQVLGSKRFGCHAGQQVSHQW